MAEKPRQSDTLPEGTVAFCMAANTCQRLSWVGQAMKPLAPKPWKL